MHQAAQQVVAADNGCAVDGIPPTAGMEIYFLGFRAPEPPLPLNAGVRHHLFRVPLSATDDELVAIARSWLDVLAAEDYERVFENLGYAMAWGAGADGIRRDIQGYRSAKLYPGVSGFQVSNWRTAIGGNPDPTLLVRRYKYTESLPIVITIELDLPLNGSWSDLEADFVVTLLDPHDSEGVLALEDICSPRMVGEASDA